MNKIKFFFQNIRENEEDKAKLIRALRAVSFGLIVFVVLYSAVTFIAELYGIGVIQTQSIDKSVIIYEKDFKESGLKGKIVFFLLPQKTPYFPQYSNFAKYVRCEGGDKLSVRGLEYFCNDELIGTAKTKDKNGKSVTPFVYEGLIPEGQYFVMGTHERSYDSRYWGFVDKNLIQGVSVWEL